MRQDELVAMYRQTGYPVAFRKFKRRPALPYILLLTLGTRNHFAGNHVHAKLRHWRAMLATEEKDPAAEAKIEAVMDKAGICWEIEDEDEIEDEALYQVLYDFEQLEGGR